MMDPESDFIRTGLHIRVSRTWSISLTDHAAALVALIRRRCDPMHPSPRLQRSFSTLSLQPTSSELLGTHT